MLTFVRKEELISLPNYTLRGRSPSQDSPTQTVSLY